MIDQLIIFESDYYLADKNIIGGKAKGLGRLNQFYERIPKSFCLTTTFLIQFIEDNGIVVPLDSMLNYDDLIMTCSQIQQQICAGTFSSKLELIIFESIKELAGHLDLQTSQFIFRSSHISEDEVDSVSSGQYESKKIIGISQTLNTIKEIWVSNYSANAIEYRISRKLPIVDLGMAVICQEFVPGVFGGIGATYNPSTFDSSEVIIEYSYNDAEGLLSKSDLTSSVFLNKKDPFKECIFSKHHLIWKLLFKELLKIEAKENHPIFIEWTATETGEIYFLQLKTMQYIKNTWDNFIDVPHNKKYKSSKLVPLRWQFELGLQADYSPLIISPLAYENYILNNCKITDELLAHLTSTFLSFSNAGSISIRSVYYSSINSSNNHPQSGFINNLEDFISAIESVWKFIFENKLDDYTSQPALMVSSWLNVHSTAVVHRLGIKSDELNIEAIFGYPEGLEQNAHDKYVYSIASSEVIGIQIAEKEFYIAHPKSNPTPLPLQNSNEQVLSNDLIHQIGSIGTKLSRDFDNFRAEFLVTDDFKIIVWQMDEYVRSFPYYKISRFDSLSGENLSGSLKIIHSKKDLIELQNIDVKDKILLLDFRTENLRDHLWLMKSIRRLEMLGNPFLYFGSMMSHFSMSALEADLPIHPINDIPEWVSENEKVTIVRV
ncbi:PEP/pyruvate-binding domain-containing protein [Pedobacter sp. D749]|uniref:PEP/pyruvate-binding domain-containing protein n=1 Tax=Pedobacter sp. D749 TaxID=2856523 RepID=UPI001C591FB8|nr:PEP/pyruvate-binding domain-containing protein [Pedobacter sp. D749]QXU42798.1 PEP/pyruvate-binding domain-containing protein [Pedobacter sp. D749]